MIDVNSNEWLEIKKDIEKEIERLREVLEENDQSHAKAQFVRGQIWALRGLIGRYQPKLDMTVVNPVRIGDRSGI